MNVPRMIKRAPGIEARQADTDGDTTFTNRTRVDETDPSITFSPGPSPFVDQQQSAWLVVQDPLASNGTVVKSNKPDAQLKFNFPGDTLALDMLYKAAGISATLTLEDGKSYPLDVSATDAAGTAPNGDREALQKRVFRLEGFSCTNHTATLIPNGQTGGPDQNAIYFDGYSFPSSDSPDACTSTAATPTSTDTAATTSNSTDVNSSSLVDHSREIAGTGAGAAILGFVIALVAVMLYRRHKRRKSAVMDPPDRSYRTERKQLVLDLLDKPFGTDQRPSAPETEAVFRPRGIHALAQQEHVGSSVRQSFMESPLPNAAFPLMPTSTEHIERIDDASEGIGCMLLALQSESSPSSRETGQSTSKWKYEKARTRFTSTAANDFSPSVTPSLLGGFALKRMPAPSTLPNRVSKAMVPSKSPLRPSTASALDRQHAEARQLKIQRSLSPFERDRPTTCSNPTPTPAALAARDRFRRLSSASADTHWSRASADEPVETHSELPRSKSHFELVKPEQTTDSEAEMWVSKDKRRNSIGGQVKPKRPPRSPYRPSTAGGTVKGGSRSIVPFSVR